ncbi:MAG: Glu/Leu/Phe/Val dehydrogenase [Chlamydiales bacterium]|nr:Glu/Leu/Phe/Val dehydrogenase [Chlamydiales bacterium]
MTTDVFQDTELDLVLEAIPVTGYKKVIKVTDRSSNLTAIISMHSTDLGPALGGTRIFPYHSFDQALTDVLRLSMGMSYKSAIAGTGFGGGKAVIIADPRFDKTEKLLLSYAAAINALKGEFITAEDSGTDENDLTIMSQKTKYIAGLSHEKSGGNPSRFTAWGVYRGIQATLQALFGNDSVQGRKIAIQGLGCVGSLLADFLFWNGADLIVTDTNSNALKMAERKYGAKVVSPEEIYSQECDIFAPCAFGGVINDDTIPLLRCKAVAGGANNQLLHDQHADELKLKNILYAPDFVINAGGLINIAQELELEGYHHALPLKKTNEIYTSLLSIYDSAKQQSISTNQSAKQLAEERMRTGTGMRQGSPYFHCVE